MRFSVKAPATSANLGPGFDTIGIALDIWNSATIDTDVRENSVANTGTEAPLLHGLGLRGVTEGEELVIHPQQGVGGDRRRASLLAHTESLKESNRITLHDGDCRARDRRSASGRPRGRMRQG